MSLADLQAHLTNHVMQMVEPLLMLFDFKKLEKSVYEGIVTEFANGRIV